MQINRIKGISLINNINLGYLQLILIVVSILCISGYLNHKPIFYLNVITISIIFTDCIILIMDISIFNNLVTFQEAISEFITKGARHIAILVIVYIVIIVKRKK
jgi:uncharacterized membrane protein